MATITPGETDVKLFKAEQLHSRDIARPSYRATCIRCPWTYEGGEDVHLELVESRAKAHAYKEGHSVDICFDIIGQLLERIYPKRADEEPRPMTTAAKKEAAKDMPPAETDAETPDVEIIDPVTKELDDEERITDAARRELKSEQGRKS